MGVGKLHLLLLAPFGYTTMPILLATFVKTGVGLREVWELE